MATQQELNNTFIGDFKVTTYDDKEFELVIKHSLSCDGGVEIDSIHYGSTDIREFIVYCMPDLHFEIIDRIEEQIKFINKKRGLIR